MDGRDKREYHLHQPECCGGSTDEEKGSCSVFQFRQGAGVPRSGSFLDPFGRIVPDLFGVLPRVGRAVPELRAFFLGCAGGVFPYVLRALPELVSLLLRFPGGVCQRLPDTGLALLLSGGCFPEATLCAPV